MNSVLPQIIRCEDITYKKYMGLWHKCKSLSLLLGNHPFGSYFFSVSKTHKIGGLDLTENHRIYE